MSTNVDWLATKLAEFRPVRIHGALPISQRDKAVDAFTNSSNLVLIATPGAAKEGLTLTSANHAIFFDRGFSLDDYLQAQDRIHRISQTRECFIHNLIAHDTIDEWVDVLLTAKYRAAQLAQGDIDAPRHSATPSVPTSPRSSKACSSQTVQRNAAPKINS